MQNIYDNKEFFSQYKALRETDDNYNDLLEQPAMKKLLPKFYGKSVLDLGCGFGKNCHDFALAGAKSVVGIDLSEKMLAVAKSTNSAENIEYINADMTTVKSLGRHFDFVYSSLAFHYVEDFDSLMHDIFSVLNKEGELLFSQEHPICTGSKGQAGVYTENENGEKNGYIMANYSYPGIRRDNWFVNSVESYHRTLSQIFNALIDAGFIIEKVCEPLPDAFALKKRPGLKKEFIKPTFLIVKAKKP